MNHEDSIRARDAQGRLRESWGRLCDRLALRGDIASVYDQLLAKYTEPWRAYHNLTHIEDCLKVLAHETVGRALPDDKSERPIVACGGRSPPYLAGWPMSSDVGSRFERGKSLEFGAMLPVSNREPISEQMGHPTASTR